MDLRNRQSLDAQPLLEVPADSPVLWQGTSYDGYDGATWTHVRWAGGVLRASAVPPVAALPSGPGLTTSVETPLSRLPLAYAPGPLVAVGGDQGSVYDLGNGSVAVLGATGATTSFSVTWATPGTAARTLATNEVSAGDRQSLALPAELPARVRDLAASVTVAATSTEDKVAAIERYLRTHEKYSLTSPVPSPGVDAVDAFLFTDHVGFCEQFASAETVMLRALDIPARLATGFGGGGVPGPGGRRVYRNEDAHAWVQVGYADGRWVDSDPTAGSQRATPGSSPLDRLTSLFTALWKALTGTSAARRWTALGLLVLALAGWRLSSWLSTRRRRRPQAAQAGRRTDAGRAYDRLLARLEEQERPRRPHETLRDLLLRLRAPEPERVARLLETEWYGDSPSATPREVAAVVALLDGLALERLVGVAP